MNSARRLIFVVAAILIAGSVLGAGIVGKWKGKVVIDTSKFPQAQSPEQKKAMESGLAMLKKMQFSLNFKANNTYIAEATNVPGQTGPQKDEGTWKLEGNTLWLTSVKENGKPSHDKKPKKFLVQNGGKKISLAEAGLPPGVTVFFVR